MDLSGQKAIVTGGKSGIGKAIVELLARRGAEVLLAARNLEETTAVAAEISQSTGQRIIPADVDVANSNQVRAMVELAQKELGRIDILVNNAGTTRDALILRMKEEDWDTVLDTNLKGVYLCSKAVIRSMMKQHYGRIVNISSVSGLAGQVGQTNYSASKAGVIGFSKALAREVASRQITVNVVAPGFVPTTLTVDLPEELKEAMIKLTPLGRWGTPEEIAYAVAFLASAEAAYITGQVLSVDGGMAMM